MIFVMPRNPVIGLVVNPQAGRDIRRLIAYASVFDNSEKMNIVRKLVMTLLDFGINRYLVMPEPDGIIETALRTLPEDVLRELDVEFVPIRVTGTWVDTYNAMWSLYPLGLLVRGLIHTMLLGI